MVRKSNPAAGLAKIQAFDTSLQSNFEQEPATSRGVTFIQRPAVQNIQQPVQTGVTSALQPDGDVSVRSIKLFQATSPISVNFQPPNKATSQPIQKPLLQSNE